MKSFTTLFPISCLREHVLFSWWLFLWVSQGRRRTSDCRQLMGISCN